MKIPITFSISIKINSHDFIDDGFTEDDSRQLAILLEEAGVDFIELSGGTYESMLTAFEYKVLVEFYRISGDW